MYKVSSPTRIDLVGGTLDLWPLSQFFGPVATINQAITVMTEVELCPAEKADMSQSIHVQIPGLKFDQVFKHPQELLSQADSRLSLLQVVVDYFKPEQGFKIWMNSQSPVGGGLGGSSSLLISLLKAFNFWLDKHPEFTAHQWVHLAHNLEAKVLKTPTGTQDYYPAFLGGINVIHYHSDRICVEQLDQNLFNFDRHGFLVNTGRSHHSGLNNFDVLSRAVAGEAEVLTNLKNIQQLSLSVLEQLRLGQAPSWLEVFAQEYQFRIALSPHFSSPEIERLKRWSQSHSGVGVKILGAGGGGCLLVWVEQAADKLKYQQQVQAMGFEVLDQTRAFQR